MVARNGWPSLADPLEGDRSVGAVKWCRFRAGNGCAGSEVRELGGCRLPPPARGRPPPRLYRSSLPTSRWAIAGRPPGGRPLRPRHEMVLIYGRPLGGGRERMSIWGRQGLRGERRRELG